MDDTMEWAETERRILWGSGHADGETQGSDQDAGPGRGCVEGEGS